MIKKLFWISLGLFILTLIFLGIYNFAFKNNPYDPIADPEKYAAHQAEQEKSQEEGTQRSYAFELVFPETILFPKIDGQDLFYYSLRDKNLKRISLETRESSILVHNIPGTVKRLLWAPNFIGVLAQVEDTGSIRWNFIDFRDQSTTPLRGEMSRLSWNTLGDGIYYLYTDPATGEKSLNTATYYGSDWKKLIDLGKNDYFVASIPQSSQVAFWTRPDGLEESRLESISLTGENHKTLFTGRYGADYLWSPNSRSILVGSTEGKGSHTPTIGLVDENGGAYRDLFIPTLISKIVWSKDNQTLYYSLPNAFPTGTILPNDYFGKPILTKDTFWKMNIKTGKRERLVQLNDIDQAFDATDLFLSLDETKLYFIDRATSKLYQVNL